MFCYGEYLVYYGFVLDNGFDKGDINLKIGLDFLIALIVKLMISNLMNWSLILMEQSRFLIENWRVLYLRLFTIHFIVFLNSYYYLLMVFFNALSL